MSLFEPILKEIVEYFENSSEAQRRVSLLIENDRQAESWFKVELMNVFESSQFVLRYHPEVRYLGDDTQAKCDSIIVNFRTFSNALGRWS